jgi:hypothetical protein
VSREAETSISSSHLCPLVKYVEETGKCVWHHGLNRKAGRKQEVHKIQTQQIGKREDYPSSMVMAKLFTTVFAGNGGRKVSRNPTKR